MGTQLYISAKWDDAVMIFSAAIEAGFSEDEIQTLISGEKRRYVYCMKCYHLQEVEAKKKQIRIVTIAKSAWKLVLSSQ